MTDGFSLSDGMDLAGIGLEDLWLRYAALGGNNDRDQLRNHLAADSCPDEHDHNIIAQALNDTFIERGSDHPVAYKDLGPFPDPPS